VLNARRITRENSAKIKNLRTDQKSLTEEHNDVSAKRSTKAKVAVVHRMGLITTRVSD
jgi:hypothetical protein